MGVNYTILLLLPFLLAFKMPVQWQPNSYQKFKACVADNYYTYFDHKDLLSKKCLENHALAVPADTLEVTYKGLKDGKFRYELKNIADDIIITGIEVQGAENKGKYLEEKNFLWPKKGWEFTIPTEVMFSELGIDDAASLKIKARNGLKMVLK